MRASPLGFGLPRGLTFVALTDRLSSIVVPREREICCCLTLRAARNPRKRSANGKLACTHIVNTTRNSAFPLSIRSYASFTFSSGYFSTIAFTPVNSANRSVSSESIAVPEGQP